MKIFNRLIKIVAIALIFYVFILQRADYYAELRGKPVAHPVVAEKVKPAEPTPAPAPAPAKTK